MCPKNKAVEKNKILVSLLAFVFNVQFYTIVKSIFFILKGVDWSRRNETTEEGKA